MSNIPVGWQRSTKRVTANPSGSALMVERALENPQDFRAAQEIQNLREERLMKEVIKGLSKTGYTLLGDQKPTARHSACLGIG